MPRNGSGAYSLPQAPFVVGTTISSTAVNSNFSDIASALTGSLPRDGQAAMTGTLRVPDGTALLPAYTFTNETTTGFYRIGPSQLGITVGGVLVGTVTASGITGAIGSVPVGTVIDYAGSTAPAGWLLCYGQAVSRATFANLFTAIGTAYGVGDGSTTFNVPDLRGTVLFGKDDMGGSASGRLTTPFYGSDPTVVGNRGGVQSRTLLTANLPAYTPSGTNSITDPGHTHTLTQPAVQYTGASAGGGGTLAGVTTVNTMTTNVTGITSGFTGNAQGGTSTAFAILPPAMVMNKIIYVGS